jgi:hypothetical protein
MLRFLRSQIVAGILSVMFLPRRMIPVTVPLAHSISGQSQGEDEECYGIVNLLGGVWG